MTTIMASYNRTQGDAMSKRISKFFYNAARKLLLPSLSAATLLGAYDGQSKAEAAPVQVVWTARPVGASGYRLYTSATPNSYNTGTYTSYAGNVRTSGTLDLPIGTYVSLVAVAADGTPLPPSNEMRFNGFKLSLVNGPNGTIVEQAIDLTTGSATINSFDPITPSSGWSTAGAVSDATTSTATVLWIGSGIQRGIGPTDRTGKITGFSIMACVNSVTNGTTRTETWLNPATGQSYTVPINTATNQIINTWTPSSTYTKVSQTVNPANASLAMQVWGYTHSNIQDVVLLTYNPVTGYPSNAGWLPNNAAGYFTGGFVYEAFVTVAGDKTWQQSGKLSWFGPSNSAGFSRTDTTGSPVANSYTSLTLINKVAALDGTTTWGLWKDNDLLEPSGFVVRMTATNSVPVGGTFNALYSSPGRISPMVPAYMPTAIATSIANTNGAKITWMPSNPSTGVLINGGAPYYFELDQYGNRVSGHAGLDGTFRNTFYALAKPDDISTKHAPRVPFLNAAVRQKSINHPVYILAKG